MEQNFNCPKDIIKEFVDKVLNGYEIMSDFRYFSAWNSIELYDGFDVFDNYICVKLKYYPDKIDYFYKSYFLSLIKKWKPVSEEDRTFAVNRLLDDEQKIKEIFFLDDDGYYETSKAYNPSFHKNRKINYLTNIIEKLIEIEVYDEAYRFINRNESSINNIWTWLDMISSNTEDWRMLIEASDKYRRLLAMTSDYRKHKWGIQSFFKRIFDMIENTNCAEDIQKTREPVVLSYNEIGGFTEKYRIILQEEHHLNTYVYRKALEDFHKLVKDGYFSTEFFPEMVDLEPIIIPLLNTYKTRLPESIYNIGDSYFEEKLNGIEIRIDELFKLEIDRNIREQIYEIPMQEADNLVQLALGKDIFDQLVEFDDDTDIEVKSILKDSENVNNFGTIMMFLRTGEFLNATVDQYLDDSNLNIDLTYLVSSYFKAVELFLCKKIAQCLNGTEVEHYKRNIEIGSFDYYTDTTIGNYRHYIKNNRSKLFKPKYQNKKYCIELREDIRKWLNECRNALEHKDYIDTLNRVGEIRNASINLIKDGMKYLN